MSAIIVCGSRRWQDRKTIRRTLEELDEDTVIIHSCAKGAAKIAGEEARELGLGVAEVRANEFHEEAAGPARNDWMLQLKPEKVIAFTNTPNTDRGVMDLTVQAKKSGVQVEIVSSKPQEEEEDE